VSVKGSDVVVLAEASESVDEVEESASAAFEEMVSGIWASESETMVNESEIYGACKRVSGALACEQLALPVQLFRHTLISIESESRNVT